MNLGGGGGGAVEFLMHHSQLCVLGNAYLVGAKLFSFASTRPVGVLVREL